MNPLAPDSFASFGGIPIVVDSTLPSGEARMLPNGSILMSPAAHSQVMRQVADGKPFESRSQAASQSAMPKGYGDWA